MRLVRRHQAAIAGRRLHPDATEPQSYGPCHEDTWTRYPSRACVSDMHLSQDQDHATDIVADM